MAWRGPLSGVRISSRVDKAQRRPGLVVRLASGSRERLLVSLATWVESVNEWVLRLAIRTLSRLREPPAK